jgi:acyl carrier protein
VDSVEARVVDYVKTAIGPWAKDATPDSRLQELGVDSFGLFELLMGLEQEFGISIRDEDFSIARFQTVKNMIEYVTAGAVE